MLTINTDLKTKICETGEKKYYHNSWKEIIYSIMVHYLILLHF